ncbi:hypothetical protein RIF29_34069 [Crotalaria pallida]|uniref:Uncharacterized protein n=1 Tax=Crotalaria pallida TaxID=3830 RepID=A0AAN9HT69_CROPI
MQKLSRADERTFDKTVEASWITQGLNRQDKLTITEQVDHVQLGLTTQGLTLPLRVNTDETQMPTILILHRSLNRASIRSPRLEGLTQNPAYWSSRITGKPNQVCDPLLHSRNGVDMR